jgi:tripartite-type tricarboxylate transporter receptor subunit TctC
LPRIAVALDYPTRTVRLIVGFATAGVADILARLIGQRLSEPFGQPFVIENRPGAGGNVGTEAVVRAPADGYTLLLVGAWNAINATLYDNLNFNFIRDIAPVAGIMRVPQVMEVNPSVPVKTVPEFIAYAKANSGKINFASAGNGTPSHVSGELFKMMTGVNMQHVPYRSGGAALTDLLGSQVQVMFDSTASSIEHIRAGRLYALAVTTAMRSEALPDIPTVSDFVQGYEASGFGGVGAPKNTPPEIIEKLNRETNIALADPSMKARLSDLGGMMLSGSPAESGCIIAAHLFSAPRLLDHIVGAGKQERWNLQAERLGGLEIDGKREPVRELDRQVAGLGAFEDAVGVARRLPILMRQIEVGAVRQQAAVARKIVIAADRGQAIAHRQVSDQLLVQAGEGVGRQDQPAVWLARDARQRGLDVGGGMYGDRR